MKKRISGLFLAAVLLLSACGSRTNPVIIAPDGSNLSNQGEKTELVLATINDTLATAGLDSVLREAVTSFNQSQDKYSVTICDYSQNGVLNAKEAERKLNTELISGQYPDMVCFSNISMSPYLAKGLLLDLRECMERDASITSDDLVGSAALQKQDEGIFYLSSDGSFSTLAARFSDFGDRYGWSFGEYLERESELDSNVWLIYNITHSSFLREVAERYSRDTIDWRSGTCHFDNLEFIEILKASMRIQDKPETDDNMLFGPGGTLVAQGKLVAALVYGDQVSKLALSENDAGQKLSYIGWPTVDGRCGTDLKLGHPVGILSKGNHIDGCWEFMKHYLTNGGYKDALPMYKPRLLSELEDAKTKKDNPVPLTDEQAERFLDLLDHIENVAIYDETVMDIIMSESEDFFAGHRTAEETADIIQSKVRLYLAELK